MDSNLLVFYLIMDENLNKIKSAVLNLLNQYKP
jgi:hypothetical protein